MLHHELVDDVILKSSFRRQTDPDHRAVRVTSAPERSLPIKSQSTIRFVGTKVTHCKFIVYLVTMGSQLTPRLHRLELWILTYES